jgi:hypothetical protein
MGDCAARHTQTLARSIGTFFLAQEQRFRPTSETTNSRNIHGPSLSFKMGLLNMAFSSVVR